jgi:uncharacterized protein (DUF2141 family)
LQATPSGDFSVEISNVKQVRGNIRVALYHLKEDFLTERVYRGKEERVTANKMVVKFTDLPFGTYAISVFHDENENGQLDTGIFGIPKEPYGFGNNAMGAFGPPDFNEASIIFQANSPVQSISLR